MNKLVPPPLWIVLCVSVSLYGPMQVGASDISELDFFADLPVVLTASRLEQPLMDAPAPLTVIDRQMIEASGFRELADLMRLVPGYYVGHASGWKHYVTRGFGDDFARQMQVLVDGRSVYLPTFGGVRWDALPLDIEDIERIEVARGPNAATYGANAFMGIVNIITRHAADVPRHTLAFKSGEKGVFEAYYRHAGGQPDNRYLLTLSHQENDGYDGQFDSQYSPSATLRWELKASETDSLSLRLGYKGGTRGTFEVVNSPRDQDVHSHYQQFDWRRELDAFSSLEARLYHSHTRTSERIPLLLGAPLQLAADRWDGEVQLRQELDSNLRLVTGLSLREDSVWSPQYYGRQDHLHTRSQSAFGHLEWRPATDWLVNVGGMLESHDIGGARASPRLALHWQPHYAHSLRLGVSRAFRNPVQFEENARLLPTFISQPPGLKPEEVTATDLGYLATWPEQDLSLNLRLFRERYRNLITPKGMPRDFNNADTATLEGVDGSLQWQPRPHTRVIANFARTLSRSTDTGGPGYYSDATPTYLYGLLVSHRLPGDVDISTGYYWTGPVQVIGTGIPPLPASQRMDLRIAKNFVWSGARINLALVLQNVLDPYQEYDSNPYNQFDGRGYVSLKAEF